MAQMTWAVQLCVMQTSFLALIAILGAWLTRNQTLLSRAWCASALVTIALLTILAPIPMPQWALFHFAPGLSHVHNSPDLSDRSESLISGQISKTGTDNRPAIFLSGSQLRQLLNDATQLAGDSARVNPADLFWCITLFVVSLNLWGGIKLVSSLCFARRIMRQSTKITDSRALHALSTLQSRAQVAGPIALVESRMLHSAAVFGLYQPTILLPSRWHGWSDVQLQSVIAHELAHVVRYDAAWRLVSCSVAIVHHYNPLVHWLTRFLAFAQESAADQLASQIIGKKEYVHALSSLALEHEDRKDVFNETGMYPVFSGFLIRRIKMLRRKTEWNGRFESLATRGVAAGLMAVCGMLLLSVRGLTQEVADFPAPAPLKVARLESAHREQLADPTQGMFQRTLSDIGVIPETESGAISVRFADMIRATNAQTVLPAINQLASRLLQNWLGGPNAIEVDLNRIDRLVGVLQLETNYDAAAVENKHSISLGSRGMRVELDQAWDIKEWAILNAPQATVSEDAGTTEVSLPAIPEIVPVPIVVVSSDPKSLSIGVMTSLESTESAGSRSLQRASAHDAGQTNLPKWTPAFRQVDGGLITLATVGKHPSAVNTLDASGNVIRSASEDTNQSSVDAELNGTDRSILLLASAAETLAVGVDIAEDGQQLGIRICISCEDAEQCEAVVNNIQLLTETAINSLASEDTASVQDELTMQIIGQLIERLSIRKDRDPGGKFLVNLRSNAECPPEFGLNLVRSMLSADSSSERQISVSAKSAKAD